MEGKNMFYFLACHSLKSLIRLDVGKFRGGEN